MSVTRVSISSDGTATEDTGSGHVQVNAPVQGGIGVRINEAADKSFRHTAHGETEVSAGTTKVSTAFSLPPNHVEVAGMVMEAKAAVHAGLGTMVSGEFIPSPEFAGGQPSQETETAEQAAAGALMNDAEAAALNEVLAPAGLTQGDLDATISAALPSLIRGDGSLDGAINALSQRTGADPARCAEIVEKGAEVVSRSLDRVFGGDSEEAQAFYADMRETDPQAFGSALTEALLAGRTDTLKYLAENWKRMTTPNEDELRAAGFKTARDENGRLMASRDGKGFYAADVRVPLRKR